MEVGMKEAVLEGIAKKVIDNMTSYLMRIEA